MIDKLNAFLAELERRGIEISGDTAFLCNDGLVTFIQNDRGGVDVSIVPKVPIWVDYTLGITENDIEDWQNTEELFDALGGSENGGD